MVITGEKVVSWYSPKADSNLLSLTLKQRWEIAWIRGLKHERNLYYIIQAHFLPTPYNPRGLVRLFISKLFVTSLEKLFIGLQELTARKSSHVSELGALLNYFFSYKFFPCGYSLSFVIDYKKDMHWHGVHWICLWKVFRGLYGKDSFPSIQRLERQQTWGKKGINIQPEWSICKTHVNCKTSCFLYYLRGLKLGNQLNKRKAEIWGNVANISTET